MGYSTGCHTTFHHRNHLVWAPKYRFKVLRNKTDANDADGLAQLAEIGYFKQVKSFDSMLTRTLVAARTRLVRITVELSNQIRGLMKTFGLVVPAGQGIIFEKNVHDLLVGQDGLAKIILPMLGAWRGVRERAAELSRHLVADARNSEACQILMSIRGWLPSRIRIISESPDP